MSDDPAGGANSKVQELSKLKTYLVAQVQRELEANPPPVEQRREAVNMALEKTLEQTRVTLSRTMRAQLFHDVTNDMLGYGPIQPFLEDNSITEVMVNGHNKVFIERNGVLEKTGVRFDDDDHVLRIINRIVLPLGRRIDAESPTVDARLPDGSRVNAIIPPVAIDGPSLTIRKFSKERLGVADLIRFGSLTEPMAQFLRACVKAHLNIIISGGTGSGKTTLLNILSSYIPDKERIVTIEDAAELQLQQDHVVRLETKAQNADGKGGVDIRHLVRNSLRMRPDRIVVGECRGGEALDMLQAMNTGHDGSLTTIHANTPRDCLARLETLVLMAGMDLPIKVIREQVASAVDLIIQQTRLPDGSRKVTFITEVAGMEGDTIVMTDVFKFEQTGTDANGKVLGQLVPTGIRPLFMPRLERAGFELGRSVFMPTTQSNTLPNQRH